MGLDGLQIGDDGVDLIRGEDKLRHLGVTGPDPFSQSLCQTVYGIALIELAEVRSLWVRAFALGLDRMAAGTVGLNQIVALLDERGLSKRRTPSIRTPRQTTLKMDMGRFLSIQTRLNRFESEVLIRLKTSKVPPTGPDDTSARESAAGPPVRS